MDHRLFILSYTVISITVLILGIVITFVRKTKTLKLFSLAFAFFAMNGITLALYETVNVDIIIIFSDLFFTVGNLLLYAATRSYYKASSMWPRRFWGYILVAFILILYFTLAYYNITVRSVFYGVLCMLIFVDFLFFLKRMIPSSALIVKVALLFALISNIIAYIMRISMVIIMVPSDGNILNNSFINLFAYIAYTFTSSLWLCTVILMGDSEFIEEMKVSEEKYRLISENTSDVIWVKNITKNKYTYVSPSIKQLLGYTQEEFLALNNEDFITESRNEDFTDSQALLEENYAPSPGTSDLEAYILLSGQKQMCCKDGVLIWTEYSEKSHHNKMGEVEIYGVTRNIEERKKAEQKIRELSYRDQLTGLYNRHFLQERVSEEIYRSGRYEGPISMVSFDIDHFKKINDRYGHPAGDEVLKEIAEIVTKMIRQSDLLFRTGGEEFMLIMPETDGNNAKNFAERIRQTLENNENPKVGIYTCSFGVGEKLKDESFDQWYGRVDKALYSAKDSGRNQVFEASGEQPRIR